MGSQKRNHSSSIHDLTESSYLFQSDTSIFCDLANSNSVLYPTFYLQKGRLVVERKMM